MALAGPDIIGRIVLDDRQFRAALKKVESDTRSFAGRLEGSLDVRVAQRGLMALNSTTLLLAGTTGFLYLEVGRASIAMARFAGELRRVGGLALLLGKLETALGTAMVAFSKFTGVILIGGTLAIAAAATAIVGLIAALTWEVATIVSANRAWRDYTERGIIPATEASTKLAKKLKDQRLAMDAARMAELRANTKSYEEWRVTHTGPPESAAIAGEEDRARIDALERQIREALGARPSDFENDPEIKGKMIILEAMEDEAKARERHTAWLNDQWDQTDRVMEEFADKQRKYNETVDSLARSLAIGAGFAKQSDFEADPRLRALMRLGERETGESSVVTPGFGISTRPTSAFQFRQRGDQSTIGEQRTERVERKVDTLIDLLKKDVAANEDVARVLTQAGTQ